jgi:2-polyprenyl-3-methyl-5-hydroxy-6-metoxy-1,4-benzoquinol methylase
MPELDHGPVPTFQDIALRKVTPPGSGLMASAFRCCPAVLHDKYGDLSKGGWGPRQRLGFGHLTPADWYEALLDAVVTPQTIWLDVGCGRNLSPGNTATARRLADRCSKLVGIDPSDNIDDNPFVHERLKMPIEDHPPGRAYKLITLRMVAEHVEAPEAVARQLAGLLLPGGRIVIYTVGGYSPSVLVAASTPLSVHHVVKRLLWRTEERDTFPTVYRMNTRAALRRLFCGEGLSEEMFEYLGDCRATARFRSLQYLELSVWKTLSLLGLSYPEVCILAVYRSV